MKEYKKLTEAESIKRLKKYDEIKEKIRKGEKKEIFSSVIFIISLLSIFLIFPKDGIGFIPLWIVVTMILGFIAMKIESNVTNFKKQKEYFDDIFKEERKEERATFEGVITLTNGQEVPGIFIQKGDGFFERKTETLYYKDKILAVKINEN